MRPYKENFDIGHFGVDNPATAIAESMPFVVEYREDVDLAPAGLPGQKADFVSIGVVEAAHGSHVAGIAAGHGLFGGAMDGQAPGAKIVSSRACSWGGGCTSVALTSGMIDLVENRGVDVVNMSIGGLPALNDGNNARARLYDALIDGGVQLVISAGNSGPGINTIGDPSVASKVISVASSVTKETWLSNYGAEVSTPVTLHNYSSRGPREDGGFKPNVAAPGSAISSIPTWQPGGPVPEAGYALPPGYAMFNGTSMASPQTAGAVALLLSAAKAGNVSVTPRQIRDSVYTSADFIQGVEAIGQGAGLVDVNGAWNLLKTKPAANDITVTAPVCTPMPASWPPPAKDPASTTAVTPPTAVRSRREQDLHRQGHSHQRCRRSGRAHPATRGQRRHVLAADDEPSDAQGGTVDIPVKARTSTPGAHSAILEIDDPATNVVDQRVLTVVLSQDLAAPSFASARPTRLSATSSRAVRHRARSAPRRCRSTFGCRRQQPGPLDRDQPVRPPGGVDLVPGLLHQLQRPIMQQHLAFLREAVARHLGARGRGTAHDAEPGEPVHHRGRGPGRRGRPGQPDDRLGDDRVPSPVSWTVTNAFGQVTATPPGGIARQLQDGASDDRQPRGPGVHRDGPGGRDALHRDHRQAVRPGADLDLFVRAAGCRGPAGRR